MGSCCSKSTEATSQDPEKKWLIPQPEGGEQGSLNLQCACNHEDTLFISILAKMAKSIINISTMDSSGMKQYDCIDRVHQYRASLVVLSESMSWRSSTPLPNLTNEPFHVLSAHFVPSSDLQQVSKVATFASSSVMQVRVEMGEEVVVQFPVS